MRNSLILGSGRSGTSLVAGLAARAGYAMGEPLHPPNMGNPQGRFESIEVNTINEELLGRVMPQRSRKNLFDRLFKRHIPLKNQRWLAALPLGIEIPRAPDLEMRMLRLMSQQPFCYKDPRFSYTLPSWRPVLADTVYVCVFRHPAATVDSILREHREVPALHSLAMNRRRALQVWVSMYSHILERHHQAGEWLFVHDDQILAGEGVSRLELFLEVSLDRSFINPAQRRAQASGSVPAAAMQIYQRLCRLAGWQA